MTGPDDVVYDVVMALAAADGVDPTELDYSLQEFVDATWLSEMVQMDGFAGELTFEVPNHEVGVTGAGEVFVDGAASFFRGAETEVIGEGATSERPPEGDLRRFEQLFDALPGAVYQCRDPEGWLMDFISDGCRELTGYDPETFQCGGVSFGTDVVHPDDQDAVANSVRRALDDGNPYSFTFRILTADDDVKWVWTNGAGLSSGDEDATMVGYLADVTEFRDDVELLQAV